MSAVIPTVDLSRTDTKERLGDALAALGFVQLVGHGVDAAVSARLRSACDELFACEFDRKLEFVHPEPAANRGYRAKGAESLSYSLGTPAPPDLFESFNCASDRRVGDSVLQQVTPWPHELSSDFRDASEAWIVEMERLSRTVDVMVDELLGFDGEYASRTNAGPDTMACINYEPGADGSEDAVEGQQRMGAHSDYTSFTFLDADPVPGLQIVDGNGDWVDVIPEPGALLMNVGDVLAMYTNDHWPSTLHRVIPMNAGSAPRRRSVAYFHYPNLDVEVAPRDTFVTDGEDPRYRPVTVADHLLAKLTAPKTKRPATGASTAAGRLEHTE